MRLNTANRSFFALVAIAVVPYIVLGTFACGVLSVAGYRTATEGWSALGDDDLQRALPLFVIVAVGTVLAAWSMVRQLVATRRLMAKVRAQRIDAPAAVEAAARVGLRRVDVIEDAQPYSFTYGLGRPRVAVSQGLVDATSPEELDAVLAHERYHVENLDTIKVVLARALASAFFFLPALRHLRSRYLAGRELAADRAAIRSGGPKPLASALCKVVAGPPETLLGGAAAVGGSAVLDARITQIEDDREPAMPAIPRSIVAVTGAGIALTALAGMTAGTALGQGAMTEAVGGPGMGTLGPLLCGVAWAVVVLAAVRPLAPGKG